MYSKAYVLGKSDTLSLARWVMLSGMSANTPVPTMGIYIKFSTMKSVKGLRPL
jgi:hypothetical protein